MDILDDIQNYQQKFFLKVNYTFNIYVLYVMYNNKSKIIE